MAFILKGHPMAFASAASIEEAKADADADGTRSLLDLNHVSDVPDFSALSPTAHGAILL